MQSVQKHRVKPKTQKAQIMEKHPKSEEDWQGEPKQWPAKSCHETDKRIGV